MLRSRQERLMSKYGIDYNEACDVIEEEKYARSEALEEDCCEEDEEE